MNVEICAEFCFVESNLRFEISLCLILRYSVPRLFKKNSLSIRKIASKICHEIVYDSCRDIIWTQASHTNNTDILYQYYSNIFYQYHELLLHLTQCFGETQYGNISVKIRLSNGLAWAILWKLDFNEIRLQVRHLGIVLS